MGVYGRFLLLLGSQSNLPDTFAVAIDQRCSSIRINRRWNESTPATGDDSQPHINGATCCITCLRSSHTRLGVNSKINPLTLCSIQIPSTVHLIKRHFLDYFVPCNCSCRLYTKDTRRLRFQLCLSSGVHIYPMMHWVNLILRCLRLDGRSNI